MSRGWIDRLARAICVGAFLLGTATTASADCTGDDLLAQMEVDDPAQHADIYREAATYRNHEGLLWRIDAPDGEPSYLFGTFHSADHGVPELAMQVKAHIAEARLLFTEMSLTEYQSYSGEVARQIVANPTPGLRQELGENLFNRLKKKLRLREIPESIDETLPAWAAIELIWSADCKFLAYANGDERPMLDHALMIHARDSGVRSLGLETARKALNLHRSQDREVQIELLRIYLSDADMEHHYFTTSRKAHGRRETMAPEIMFRRLYPRPTNGTATELTAYDFWWDKVIVERNHNFMRRVLPQLRKGNVVIAVGAMHLPTDDGMVELLRAEGFAVTRIE